MWPRSWPLVGGEEEVAENKEFRKKLQNDVISENEGIRRAVIKKNRETKKRKKPLGKGELEERGRQYPDAGRIQLRGIRSTREKYLRGLVPKVRNRGKREGP